MDSPFAQPAAIKFASLEPPPQSLLDSEGVMKHASAYAWFYRPLRGGPGKWRYAGPARCATIVKHMKNRKVTQVPLGEVWHPHCFNSRYEYICIRVDVPADILEEIQNV